VIGEHSLVSTLRDLRARAEREVASAGDLAALEEWRIRYLGTKGAVRVASKGLGSLEPAERPLAGMAVNETMQALEAAFQQKLAELRQAAVASDLAAEAVDVTLPGRRPLVGIAHPLFRTLQDITRIFGSMGFSVAEGPQVEWDRYNFELLNIPADHPSRDTMDTFYVDVPGGILLRTHTSPVQARVMLSQRPPVRVIVPGRVFRRDQEDASHLSAFWQVEGLAVDTNVTFSDLKGVLANFAQQILGCKVRFRPHHFQFTEPSAEFDFSCLVCGGRGCRTCKYEGWLEISGAGMVHPQVLRFMDYDPAVYSGFAFGMGPERITMMRYGINDIRLLSANDPRFLRQFA